MQQWRVILAVLLSMGVFYAYSAWMAPPHVARPAQQPVATAPANPTSESAVTPTGPKESQPTEVSSSGIPQIQPSSEAQTLSLENKEVLGEISSQGAVFVSWALKNYHQDTSPTSPLINLLRDQGGGEALVLTLGSTLHDRQQPVYSVGEVTQENGERVVVLKWTSEALEVQKEFRLSDKSPHLVEAVVRIKNKSAQEQAIQPRIWISRTQKAQPQREGFFSFLHGKADVYHPLYFSDGKLHSIVKLDDLGSKEQKTGKIYWSGLSDRYFLLALISRQGSDEISIQYGKAANNRIYTSLSYGSVSLAPGETLERKYSAYLGIKKLEELETVGAHLEKSIERGFFGGVLAAPILWLLMFFHKVVGNWGLAIIALTFFIKLLLHPVNKKSLESMREMQKLQPKLKDLREKFKDNREKLNMEMMMLFKSHKVNPMGGCLPMIIQMPIYIALYNVLWNSTELYHAPFFGFYRDLAAPDPYFIMPILLGILFLLQQKFSPQSATVDPAQQKVMMIMPLMFTAFMIFLPVGLVLYITVNTVMTVAQQYMVQHEMSFADIVKRWKK